MNRPTRARAMFTSVGTALLAASACNSTGQASDAAPLGTGIIDARQPATTGRYIPLAVGAGWSWQGTDTLTGSSGVTDSRVEALEMLTGAKAGVSAYRIRSVTLSGSTVNWQQDTGTSIVRHREEFFDVTGTLKSDHQFTPEKLRLDEDPARTVLGATWTETYSDTVTAPLAQPASTATITWTVEAVDEMVTVPAGTFSCLRVHSVDSSLGGYDSTFWFARNVGKVKESGTEIRDLIGYLIP